MINELLFALGVALLITTVVGFIIRGILGRSSLFNFIIQTSAVYYITTGVLSFTFPQLVVAICVPAVLHLLYVLLSAYIIWRVRRGDYGKETMWALELYEEEDEHFIHANNVLPDYEVREVRVIADSKDELRNLTIERYNELTEELSGNGPNYNV